MAPQHRDDSGDSLVYDEEHVETLDQLEERTLSFSLSDTVKNLRNLDYSKVVWKNVFIFVVLHTLALGALDYLFFVVQWKTLLLFWAYGYFGGIGITMGAHRLWSHRSFKAKLPLRILLALGQTIAMQNHIYDWVRDHRVHHKFAETDGDPHNAKRGLFFAHIGWLMYRKHPDVYSRGRTVDVSDLLEDPVVRFQRNYYIPLALFFSFVVPVAISCIYLGETLKVSFLTAGVLRYVVSLHSTWTVNSLAHWVGHRPYDNTIHPSENSFVALVALGEGWHNFHHVFPFDYRTSEFGGLMNFNVTAVLIDMFAKIGWAYDLKEVDRQTVVKRMQRTGIGHPSTHLVRSS